jgi:hypothetical protein
LDAGLLTKLTDELKDALRITWDEEDESLNEIIKRAEAYLLRLTGASFAFLTEEWPKEILLERCRYVYNNAADEFEVNFKSELTRLIMDVAIGKIGLIAPSNLEASDITDTTLTLSWNAVKHHEGIANYEIFRDGVSIALVPDTTYEDDGLIASTQYRYRIKAITHNDFESKLSGELIVTTNEGV